MGVRLGCVFSGRGATWVFRGARRRAYLVGVFLTVARLGYVVPAPIICALARRAVISWGCLIGGVAGFAVVGDRLALIAHLVGVFLAGARLGGLGLASVLGRGGGLERAGILGVLAAVLCVADVVRLAIWACVVARVVDGHGQVALAAVAVGRR
jgi:hypothetical protein